MKQLWQAIKDFFASPTVAAVIGGVVNAICTVATVFAVVDAGVVVERREYYPRPYRRPFAYPAYRYPYRSYWFDDHPLDYWFYR